MFQILILFISIVATTFSTLVYYNQQLKDKQQIVAIWSQAMLSQQLSAISWCRLDKMDCEYHAKKESDHYLSKTVFMLPAYADANEVFITCDINNRIYTFLDPNNHQLNSTYLADLKAYLLVYHKDYSEILTKPDINNDDTIPDELCKGISKSQVNLLLRNYRSLPI